MTDHRTTITNSALDKLPLFASDLELAVAIVGKENASRWKREVLPTLEHRGFPRFDPLHQGRAIPLVRKFYEGYFGLTMGAGPLKPGGEKKVWLGTRVEKKIANEERRRANGEDVTESDPGTTNPDKLQAIAEYRAKIRKEFAGKKAPR